MKNQVFSLRRYLNLLRIEWVETYQSNYISSLFRPFIIYLCMNFFSFWSQCIRVSAIVSNSEAEQICDCGLWMSAYNTISSITLAFLILYVIMRSAGITSQMASKKSRIRYLMQPGTTLEKYLVMLKSWGLTVFVILPLTVLIVEVLRVAAFSVFYPSLNIPWIGFSYMVGDGGMYLFYSYTTLGWIALGLFLFSSVYIFGAMLWRKGSVIKTTGALALLFAICTWSVYTIVVVFFEGNGIELDKAIMHLDQTSPKLYALFSSENFYRILLVVGGLAFHVLAYFRLRETDLTNRW